MIAFSGMGFFYRPFSDGHPSGAVSEMTDYWFPVLILHFPHNNHGNIVRDLLYLT
jgi:hypothetical protein